MLVLFKMDFKEVDTEVHMKRQTWITARKTLQKSDRH